MTIIRKFLFGCGVLLCLNAVATADTSPVPMLEQSANQILSTLKTNKSALKTQPQIVYQAVERHLLPHVDVRGMARSVLGREAWQKASDAEKTAFMQAFTRLVIRTYASPLSEYNQETIQFYPIKTAVNERFVRAKSLIVRPHGKNIPLSYSLVAINGDWKIYDFSVEGVSLLQSFRSQFADALHKSTIQAVTQQLNQQQLKKQTAQRSPLKSLLKMQQISEKKVA
ncbi:MAG: ABC transporter substrate-binding protein [Legionella sp.]|nr:ABC transporter substrate-binding protein [Legionella sp.]